ncbi:MAG: porin [Proteobacteria bacterium]|nr:porin [Pseudomonadota bacterium]
MNKRMIILQSGLLLVLCSFTVFAHAGNEALMALLKALHENGTIDANTYELVKRVAAADMLENSTHIDPVSRSEVERSTQHVPDENIARLKTDVDKAKPKFKIGGRMQMDAATFAEDQRRHNDGKEIRRARLFVQGEISETWAYKLQYDFTGTGRSGIQDAYLDYKGLKPFQLRLGHFKEAFSLQNMTSSKYVTFIERGLPHVFAEGRNLGIQARRGGKNWGFSAGLFGEGRDGASSDNDEGWGVSARATYAPLFEKDRIWHLGVSVAHRMTGSNDDLRFSQRPESHLTNTLLVDTGIFDADSLTRIVAESAFVYGPFHLQGEYYHTMIDRDITGNPGLDFAGFYLEAGWFISGESLNYKGAGGNFGRVNPDSVVGQGGFGAWQLAFRYSSLDLNDADINGGEADSFTLGLNWFATPSLRFSANYVNVLDVKGGPGSGDEPDVFQLRAQLEF